MRKDGVIIPALFNHLQRAVMLLYFGDNFIKKE